MAYLLKVLLGECLPFNNMRYFQEMQTYFPRLFDARYLADLVKNLKGGLLEVAGLLEVTTPYSNHSAASNSYVTGLVFFKLRTMFFEGTIDEKLNGLQHALEGVITRQ
eukprot:gene5012-6959_t